MRFRFLLFSLLGVVTLTGFDCNDKPYDVDDYVVTAESLKNDLTLETDPPKISHLTADGYSSLVLVATLPADADPARRMVVFTTSAGTLVGAGKRDKLIEIQADAGGHARVQLVSSTTIESAFVRAEAKSVPGALDTMTVFFVPIVRDSVRFIEAADSALADGASLPKFSVQIPEGTPGDQRKIQVSIIGVSGATIVPNGTTSADVPADVSGRAGFNIKSPLRTGAARVIVSSHGRVIEHEIDFTTAPPDAIVLDASAFKLAAGPANSITLNAQLRRQTGIPSLGTPVDFFAITTAGDTIHTFRNITTSNETGMATAIFSMTDASYRGPLTLYARVGWIVASTQIVVTDT
jgi:hypothetical protein